jgi:PAS domain S-box-containing protein
MLAQSVLFTRSDAITAADRDGIIRFWNPGLERIFGHVRDDAIGRPLDLIIPERLQQRIGMDIDERWRLEKTVTTRAICYRCRASQK